MKNGYGTPDFQHVNIETGDAGKVYHIPRRGEIYENFMEDAQDGLLTELSEIIASLGVYVKIKNSLDPYLFDTS